MKRIELNKIIPVDEREDIALADSQDVVIGHRYDCLDGLPEMFVTPIEHVTGTTTLFLLSRDWFISPFGICDYELLDDGRIHICHTVYFDTLREAKDYIRKEYKIYE